jgi:serine/threonine protein kinase
VQFVSEAGEIRRSNDAKCLELLGQSISEITKGNFDQVISQETCMNLGSESPHYCPGCLSALSFHSPCSNCGWNATDQVQQHLPHNHILLGRYYIGRVLGQGGFGITYFARDLRLDRLVAVKEYFPQEQCTRLTNRVTVRPRTGEKGQAFEHGKVGFLKEAQALAKLEGHPNIVSITDFAEANGTAYLVMAYVEGTSLKEHIAKKGGRIPHQEAINLIAQVLSALSAIHNHGLLHRDISPGNIMIGPQDDVELIDFGAARYAVVEESKSLSLILNPGYAPEEQYRTRGKQGPWTDIYAVAATLYHCIAGEAPPNALDRLAEDDLIGPSHFCLNLPKETEAAILKGLAVHSSQRFQSCEEFQRALRGSIANPNSTWRYKNAILPDYSEGLTEESARKTFSTRMRVAFAVSFIALFLMGGWLVIWQYKRMSHPPVHADQATASTENQNESRPVSRGSDSNVGVTPIPAQKNPHESSSSPSPNPSTTQPAKTPSLPEQTDSNFPATAAPVQPDPKDTNSPTGPAPVDKAQSQTIEMQKEADTLWKENRYADAVPLYDKLCAQGDQAACVSLGWAYFYGNGIQQNDVHGMDLWSKACDAGNGSGCGTLAVVYRLTGSSAAKALPFAEKGCSLNDADSCFTLGLDYWNGSAVTQDQEKAREFLQKACKLGVKAGCDPSQWSKQG